MDAYIRHNAKPYNEYLRPEHISISFSTSHEPEAIAKSILTYTEAALTVKSRYSTLYRGFNPNKALIEALEAELRKRNNSKNELERVRVKHRSITEVREEALCFAVKNDLMMEPEVLRIAFAEDKRIVDEAHKALRKLVHEQDNFELKRGYSEATLAAFLLERLEKNREELLHRYDLNNTDETAENFDHDNYDEEEFDF